MEGVLQIDVITIFPGMLEGFLGESMLKRAAKAGAVKFRLVNLRDFTTDKHRTTDDRPYGGGPGMVMKPEPIFAAVESIRTPAARVVLMTPQGRPFSQAIARDLARETHLVFVCGHYEGVDERVRTQLATDEISIGDYVLTNGALPAAVVIDAVVRLLPGALGDHESASGDSHYEGLLSPPSFTRPPVFRDLAVPEVLLSGNHARIEAWRLAEAERLTRERRPDLWARHECKRAAAGAMDGRPAAA